MRKLPTSIRPKAKTTAKNAGITSVTVRDVKSYEVRSIPTAGAASSKKSLESQPSMSAKSMKITPRGNRVLIKRIEEPSKITLTDAPKGIKGVILSVGPKCDSITPGDLVLFNSKWNDLAHAENKGTGADGAGPLERPLSYKLDPLTHLVTENDIFCKISEDVPAKLGDSTLAQEFLINRKIPGPWSE